MSKLPDIEKETETLKSFFTEYYKHDPNTGAKVFPYKDLLTKIVHREKIQAEIDIEEVEEYDADLAKSIQKNAYRYQVLIAQIFDKILPEFRERDVAYRDNLDVYIKQRILLQNQNHPDGEPRDPSNIYPPELLRRFEVTFKHLSTQKPVKIRSVNATTIGKLINIKGIVTKTTAVRPLMQVATYTCTMCSSETYQPVNSLTFTPRETCESKECKIGENYKYSVIIFSLKIAYLKKFSYEQNQRST